MGKNSFTWNPEGICIFGSWSDPKSKCLFDYWSLYHFYFTGFFYIILHHYLKIDNLRDAIKLIIFVTMLHIIEEYLGNTSRLSGEGIAFDYIAPLFNSKIKPEMREIDNDYMENSIGDVLAGVISTFLIVSYWYYFGNLPYFYLWLFIFIFIMLMNKLSSSYDI